MKSMMGTNPTFASIMLMFGLMAIYAWLRFTDALIWLLKETNSKCLDYKLWLALDSPYNAPPKRVKHFDRHTPPKRAGNHYSASGAVV